MPSVSRYVYPIPMRKQWQPKDQPPPLPTTMLPAGRAPIAPAGMVRGNCVLALPCSSPMCTVQCALADAGWPDSGNVPMDGQQALL